MVFVSLFFILIGFLFVRGYSVQDGAFLVSMDQWRIVSISAILILLLSFISVFYEKKIKKFKKYLFFCIVLVAIVTTILIVFSTLYTNFISETKGPVHWHADFEIWKCGKKLDLIDPKGLTNRIGTPVLHEHGDNRIHVEGVVVDFSDVDLHNFFDVVGGSLDKDNFIALTNNGIVEAKNGDLCNGEEGKLQVFVYEVLNPYRSQTFEQRKVEDFENFILSPYASVPPGSCIIIEFDKEKERTDKICETYKIAIESGNIREFVHGS